MTRYKVEVAPELLTHYLTTGAKGPAWKITEGLPPGCRLVDIQFDPCRWVKLMFAAPGESLEPTDVDVVIWTDACDEKAGSFAKEPIIG